MNIQEMHSWFDVLQDKGDSPYFTVAEKTQFLNRAQTKFVNDVMFQHYFASGQQPEGNAIPYNSINSIQSAEDILAPLITELRTSDAYREEYYPDGTGSASQYTPSLNRYGRFNMFQLNRYAQAMLKDRDQASHNAASYEKVKVLHILSISWSGWNNITFRYVRRADVEKMKSNAFKAPTIEDPVFYLMTGGTGDWGQSSTFQVMPRTLPDGINISKVYDDGTYTNIDPTGAGDNTDIVDGGYNYGGEYNGIYGARCNFTVIRSPLEMYYDPLTFTTSPSSGNLNVSCDLPEWTHDDIMAIALEDAGVASRDEALMKMSGANKANIGGPKYSTERTGQQ